jgi:glycosyltransferase involved in cell wall biosynthesis
MAMKIAIDALPLRVRSAGIQRFVSELLWNFSRLDEASTFYLADFGLNVVPAPRPRVPGRGHFQVALKRLAGGVPLCWQVIPDPIREQLIRTQVLRARVDLYFGSNFLGVFHRSFKTVLAIYDLALKYYPETINPRVFKLLNRRLPEDAGKAHAILTISESTKRDVVKYLGVAPEKIHVVPCGIAPEFRPLDDPALLDRVRRKYTLPARFLLFVGTVEPRKNLSRLVEAFDCLCASPRFEHGLVLVGPRGWRDQGIVRTLQNLRARERVILTGRVPQEDLPGFYNLADLFVLPSLFEGFGMPVAEAMACGTPVVTSNVSSMPEVAGDAALLIDPHSADDLAEAIRKVLADSTLRSTLVSRGLLQVKQFSWERSAAQALSVFRQLVNH